MPIILRKLQQPFSLPGAITQRAAVFFMLTFLSGTLWAGELHFEVSKSENQQKEYTTESEINKSRLYITAGVHIAAFTTSLVMLDYLWYRDYPRSSFHFHDDLAHWKQMDKLGHITTAAHLSALSHESFMHTGIGNNKSALWGSISGVAFLTTIEIMDGFSEQWGASWSDMAANTAGAAGFLLQQLYWQEQRITWKYSFSKSGLQHYRPDLLGSSLAENMLKDYNGLTFWLSVNPSSFTPRFNIPPWLNIALGYGAKGMLGSLSNPSSHNGITLPHLERHRIWYLAPDIDFSRIPVNSNALQILFKAMNFIKFPAPTLQYSPYSGWQAHWFFF